MMQQNAMSWDAMMKDDAMMSWESMMTGDAMMKDDAMMTGESMEGEKMMEAAMVDGSYEDYSESAVNEAIAAKKDIVLFFHASWCPSCRSLDKEIRANLSQLPKNAVVFKVDYDDEKELKKKYAVTSQHTLVSIDSSWNELKKMKWGDLADIVNMLQ